MTTPPDVPLSDASDDARLRAALADRYDIQGVVGVGGMATVYRALDRKHNRTVAIKVLPSALSLAVGTDRFLREIAIRRRCSTRASSRCTTPEAPTVSCTT